jgi:hypothetical protein
MQSRDVISAMPNWPFRGHADCDARRGRSRAQSQREKEGIMAQPNTSNVTEIIKGWPDAAREAAQLVVDTHGLPQEATPSWLVWYEVSGCKRVVASKTFFQHRFPAPHTDSVESVVDYKVPPEMVSALAEFDGSIVVERTAGEVSARCHDEQANFLALNLMHDIVTGKKTSAEAREYYAKEFADYRRKRPTPYMEKLRFEPARGASADPDEPVLSDQELSRAAEEGKRASAPASSA